MKAILIILALISLLATIISLIGIINGASHQILFFIIGIIITIGLIREIKKCKE